jgi:hypothetical protein
MKYAVQTDDPFAVVNHPWQGAMMTLHLLASPPSVLLAGILLSSHILKKLRAHIANRRSGLLSLVTFAAMVGSGYLLQVVTSDRLIQALVALHVTSGGLFAGSYAIHLLISWRLVRQRSAPHAVRGVA